MKIGHVLGLIVIKFSILSVLAFGGANAVIPEMQRFVVQNQHWMNDSEFANLFALAQAAPGPNLLIVTLIGWHIAGFWGALLAILAMCLPAFVLTYFISTIWDRFRDSPRRSLLRQSLTVLTTGLIAAGAWLMTRAADHTLAQAASTIITVLVIFGTRVNPLFVMAIAAGLGYFDLI
jgi:chromate transporter